MIWTFVRMVNQHGIILVLVRITRDEDTNSCIPNPETCLITTKPLRVIMLLPEVTLKSFFSLRKQRLIECNSSGRKSRFFKSYTFTMEPSWFYHFHSSYLYSSTLLIVNSRAPFAPRSPLHPTSSLVTLNWRHWGLSPPSNDSVTLIFHTHFS